MTSMILKNARKNLKQPILVGLSAFALLTLSLAGFAADNYQITDLGKLGGNNAESSAINDNNVIVGFSSGDNFVAHAFAYRDAQMIDLGFLANERIVAGASFAFGINNGNIAVGYSTETKQDGEGNSVEVNVATYYDVDNQTINPLPQADEALPRESRAIAINDNNIVVGFASIDPPDDVDADGDPILVVSDRGFFYDINSAQMSIIGTLDDNASAAMTLRAIHDDGFAVGVSFQLVDGQNTAQVFSVDFSDPTTLTRFEIFGGISQVVWAMNAAKKIVGSARIVNSIDTEAFVYDVQTATATSLGVLNDNFRSSEAFDINDLDQIVGTSQVQNSPPSFHATLYENNELKDLSKLIGCDTGWILQDARGISNSGIITGLGVFEGERRAYLLTPLAGTAPDCDVNQSGGSMPIGGLLGLLLLGFYRRKP